MFPLRKDPELTRNRTRRPLYGLAEYPPIQNFGNMGLCVLLKCVFENEIHVFVIATENFVLKLYSEDKLNTLK